MKRLSERQAAACEHATNTRCRCRCGGALHGAARIEDVRELPAGDPHQPANPAAYVQLELASPAPSCHPGAATSSQRNTAGAFRP